MKIQTICISIFLFQATGTVLADEMTLMIEQDLQRLGYDTGEVDGEETLETTIAISKFQAENNLEITGEASADLLRALVAAPGPGAIAAAPATGTTSVPSPTASPEINAAALQAAREACLQQKVAAAEAEDKKRGLKRLFGALARTVVPVGNLEHLENLSEIYNDTAAAANDIAIIAEELGITEDDVLACGNPATQ